MRKLLAALAAALFLAASCGQIAGPPVNHAPVVSAYGPASAQPGETITISAVASDVDGDPLTFVWTSSEADDVLAAPSATSTMVRLGSVESTRTFYVRVSDADTAVTASLYTVVDRDSVLPPPPESCTRRAAQFTDADDPAHIVTDHRYASLYGAFNGPYVQPITVEGTPIDGTWWEHDLSLYTGYDRFSFNQEAFDWADPPSVRAEEGCWAIVENSTVPPDAVFRKRSDPDGWSFEWVPGDTIPEPCSMLPLGSTDWTDDGTTVTVIVSTHRLMSFFDAYGVEIEPAVTLVGVPLGNSLWKFEIPLELTERLERSNFHQNWIDWSASPADRAAMGCWADLQRSVLPPDSPFAIRSDPDGMSLEYIGDGGEPEPGDCAGKIETNVVLANANTTKVEVPSLADGTLVVLYCYGEPGSQLPWTLLSTSVVGGEATWLHAGDLDSRYTRWNFRDAVAQWGCALEGQSGVVCEADGCAFTRSF